ncbi:MAG: polyphosphate kinase 2 [Gammaproteobacteria bacterium]|nr:MAG: polyphosphate kinase 2 [Gammaproteobacteria bacterium]TLY82057.1 MAG: polyphosphate kinase 2 [Gammaproteobacteria bacterium]TLZ31594.1 MAG: polyphosphate kinase 2 [Gammaproteobacteria bacterium]TLZ51910.1 MAG: polyphosphate kinase 2 [Gammaproteobacteria bacterium]TLZ61526.1 MAG: polyphosphate kinase 2 [Gammaproteobacteria bacterium]
MKASKRSGEGESAPRIGTKEYARELRRLQIELVKLHRHVIAHGGKLLVILEGRDASGKDGTIKRIVAHLSPREVRVVAPGKPSDREDTEWYFQRYVGHLPAAREIVLFNRSWYNRAGVEYVMKFCTRAERDEFLDSAPRFERMLVRSGISLLKYYLDISREEQARRLRARRRDPLKQWKISPVDEAAQRHWRDYSRARDSMLLRTHQQHAPWILVRADDKHQARLNVIRDILARIPFANAKRKLARPDPRVAREFSETLLGSGWVAP